MVQYTSRITECTLSLWFITWATPVQNILQKRLNQGKHSVCGDSTLVVLVTTHRNIAVHSPIISPAILHQIVLRRRLGFLGV